MKKVVALLLAMCMFAAILTGCGEDKSASTQADETQTEKQDVTSKEESKNQAEQTANEVAAGTILNAPEISIDENLEDLYVYFTYPGDTADETPSMEITVDQVTEDTYIIYTTDGLLKNHEIIYEVTDSGVTKYYKDAFMEEFQQETESTQQQIEQETDDMLTILSYFTMQSSDYASFQYRKSDKMVAEITGEVYVYDLLENNEYAGEIRIDKATGLMVCLKDHEGGTMFNVQKLEVTGIEVPEYK